MQRFLGIITCCWAKSTSCRFSNKSGRLFLSKAKSTFNQLPLIMSSIWNLQKNLSRKILKSSMQNFTTINLSLGSSISWGNCNFWDIWEPSATPSVFRQFWKILSWQKMTSLRLCKDFLIKSSKKKRSRASTKIPITCLSHSYLTKSNVSCSFSQATAISNSKCFRNSSLCRSLNNGSKKISQKPKNLSISLLSLSRSAFSQKNSTFTLTISQSN